MPAPIRKTPGPKLATAALVAVLLGVLWGGLFYHLSQQRQLELEHAGQTTDTLNRVYAAQIQSVLSAVDQALLLLKRLHEQPDSEHQPTIALSENFLLRSANARAAIVTRAGWVRTTGAPVHVGDREFFQTHLAHDSAAMFIGRPEPAERGGAPVITLSRRLNAHDGSFDGVVAISLNPQALNGAPASPDASNDMVMVLVGFDRVIRAVSGPLPASFGQLGETLHAPLLFDDLQHASSGVVARTSTVDAVDRLVAWRTLEDYPAFVVSNVEQHRVLDHFYRQRTALIAATAALSAIIIGAGLWLMRMLAQREDLIGSLALSRERLIEAQRLGRIGHWHTDFRRDRVNFSDECFTIMGRAPDPEMTPEAALATIHPDDRSCFRILRDGAGGDLEARVMRPDGSVRWAHMHVSPQRDGTGALIGVFGVIQDITERKMADAAVRASEDRYRLLVDGSREGMYDRDFTTDRSWFSPRAHQLLGLPDGALSGRRDLSLDHMHPDDRRDYARLLAALLANRMPYNDAIVRMRHADGGWRWMAIRGRIVYADDGTPLRAVGSIGDVTARKTTELALLESNQCLLETERLGRVGSIVWDRASGRVTWSDSLFELRRVPKREFFTRDETLAFLVPEDRAAYETARAAAIAEQRAFVSETRVVRGDGTLAWERATAHPRFDQAGALTGIHVAIQDVTEIREAEQALRTRERELAAILDNAPVAIYLKDRDRRYRVVNRQHATSRGCTVEQMIGRTDDELAPVVAPHSRVTDREVLEHGRTTRIECPPALARAGFEHIEILKFPVVGERGEVIGLSGFTLNITERKRVEEQLRQAAKMEAVGRLASGIAHDFNNMIGAIIGFSSFLMEDLAADSRQHRYAARIAKVCDHAKDVVRQILAFSRTGEVERHQVDLREVLSADQPLVRATLPATTALSLAAGDEALPIVANAAQLHQVVLNLCVNASDALAGAPGTVTIRLARADAELERRLLEADASAADGIAVASGGRFDPARGYAAVTVSDDGCGMDQATLDRIFEPFFTTKPTGLGTGLGIPVIHGIVRAYDGAYRVVSRPGHGTAFTIYLPLVEAAVAPPAAERPAEPTRGSERILLVDDDVDMADMMSIALERLGYAVTRSNDPVEALRAAERDPTAWRLVITDHAMPGMRGTELALRLKALAPERPIILYTGHADGLEPATSPEMRAVDLVLDKPIEPKRMAHHIRALLEPAPRTPRAVAVQ